MKTCIFYDQETEYCRSTLGATEVIAAALQRAYIKITKKTVSLFVSAIVSKHILGHESVYCFIFSQASELQPAFLLNTAANMFAST